MKKVMHEEEYSPRAIKGALDLMHVANSGTPIKDDTYEDDEEEDDDVSWNSEHSTDYELYSDDDVDKDMHPLQQQPNLKQRFENKTYVRNRVCTIRARTQEMLNIFRNEELSRYSKPKNAFEYTVCDGINKAVVPPLVKGGIRKPANKSRNHFILKANRPTIFTVLCLVRDAAARLPDGVGTIYDICSLARDSQFIVDEEGVSENQLKKIVGAALFRLGSEDDPCVKFDKDTCLWTYLYGN